MAEAGDIRKYYYHPNVASTQWEPPPGWTERGVRTCTLSVSTCYQQKAARDVAALAQPRPSASGTHVTPPAEFDFFNCINFNWEAVNTHYTIMAAKTAAVFAHAAAMDGGGGGGGPKYEFKLQPMSRQGLGRSQDFIWSGPGAIGARDPTCGGLKSLSTEEWLALIKQKWADLKKAGNLNEADLDAGALEALQSLLVQLTLMFLMRVEDEFRRVPRILNLGNVSRFVFHSVLDLTVAADRASEEVRRRQLLGFRREPSAAVGTERDDGNRHVLQRAVLAAILVSRADDSEMHGPTCCTCCRCGLGVEGEMVIDEGNHGPDICTCCPHLDDVLSQQNKSWQRDRDMKSPQPDGSSPYLHDTPETSEDEGDESGKGMSEA